MTIPHLAVEELLQTAAIDVKDIPFRGGPQTVTELIGGRIDFVSLVVGTEVGQNIRLLGVFSEKRVAALPNVPTVREQGYDVSPASFGGLLAPKATPAPVLAKLAAACDHAARTRPTPPSPSARPASGRVLCRCRGVPAPSGARHRKQGACAGAAQEPKQNPGARPEFAHT